jgi:hypothetical protein
LGEPLVIIGIFEHCAFGIVHLLRESASFPIRQRHPAPQRVSNLRMVTKLWMDFRVWRA